jgi:radical SAM superfamily enzyme YgiQ (UPF0313 family)
METGQFHTDIRNIYFKNQKRIITNEIRPYIKNLDALPFMNLDMFDQYHHIGAYQGKLVKYGRFETGRGCPYNCTYCINGALHQVYTHEKKHLRHKSPGRTIAELQYGSEKIGFDIIRFVDETFTAVSEDWLAEFVTLYRAHIAKPLVIATRPECVTRSKMEILRNAHDHIQVTMGIESGSQKIRKEVCNRRMSNQTILNACHLCHELGFLTASFNMIGLPDETRDDFFETIALNRQAGVHIPMLSYFYPFEGCQLREYCLTKGYIEDTLTEVDYSVASVLKMPGFSLQEMEGLRRTFVMYVKMDKTYYPDIQKAEYDDAIFQKLVDLYNKEFLDNSPNHRMKLYV